MKANLGSLSLFWLLFFGFNLNPEHIITLSELSEGEKKPKKESKRKQNEKKKRITTNHKAPHQIPQNSKRKEKPVFLIHFPFSRSLITLYFHVPIKPETHGNKRDKMRQKQYKYYIIVQKEKKRKKITVSGSYLDPALPLDLQL
jgi:hypothetical protein